MLTDAAIRKARAKDRAYKIYDERGLYLIIKPTGSKLWHFKYRYDDKEKLLSLGPYPETSLQQARAARDLARTDLRAGLNPANTKTRRQAELAAEQSNTLAACAQEWFTAMAPTWRPKHAAAVWDSLERLAFPRLGAMPVRDITPPMVRAAVLDIEKQRAKEIARRVRQRLSAIFVHAIACGKTDTDPAGVIKAAFAPVPTKPQPAIINIEQLRDMLRAAELIPAHAVTRLAMRFLALTAARPGEVRGMTWAEIENDLWVIPAERTKMARPHSVPLSQQAMEILHTVKTVSACSPYVFPGARWVMRPMSENALGFLLNRAGYAGRHVPHGFRSSFSSIMNENNPADRAVIDLMLAHAPANKVEALYNRAEHMQRRKELSQAWANILLEGFCPASALLALPRR